MGLVCSLIVLILLVLTIVSFKKICCPIVFLNALFFVVCFGSSLHLFGMNQHNDTAFTVITIGELFLNLGYMVIDYVMRRRGLIVNSNLGNREYMVPKYAVNKLGIVIILVLLSIFTGYYFLETTALLSMGHSLSTIRLLYYGGGDLIDSVANMQRNNFIVIGTTYIYSPCQYLCIALSAYALCNKEFLFDSPKTKRILLIVTAINIVSSMFSNGGRVVLYLLIVTVLLSVFFFRRSQRQVIPKRNKHGRIWKAIILLVILALMVYVAYYVTKERQVLNSTASDLFQSIYYYFCGCVPNMQAKIDRFGTGESGYTYGLLLLLTVIRPFFTGMNFLLRIGVPKLYTVCDQFLFDAATTDLIGQGVFYNAFVSMFYYFYRDFGWVGVIIDSLILGGVLALLYYYAKKGNQRTQLFYILAMEGLSIAFVRLQIVSVGFVLSFYYSLLVFEKKKMEIV